MGHANTTVNNDHNDTNFADGSDSIRIGHVTLESGDMQSLIVGIFEKTVPQPHFHIEVEPKSAVVASTLVRVNEDGEYKLTYHFQNFQDTPCGVTVWLCEND